jgi:mannose-1-phosphate guanylyltransferase/mannose-6-phosphate isomerase
MGTKKLISTVGLEDLLIVDTEDALFIGKKGQSQTVKRLVDEMKKRNVKESAEHLVCHRPWGTYSVLAEESQFKIKRIVIDPGQRLSLQLHYHRNEHWIVIRGTAKVSVGDKETYVHKNQSVYVAKAEIHRLENPAAEPLEMIEVQMGEYVGEDDVVRIGDVFHTV